MESMSESARVLAAQSLINGQWVDGAGEVLTRKSPFGGTEASTVSAVTLAQADEAVAAARSARKLWASTPALARAEALHKAGDLIKARTDEAAKLITREMGKPYAEAVEDVDYAVHDLKMAAEDALRNYGQTAPGTS